MIAGAVVVQLYMTGETVGIATGDPVRDWLVAIRE
jgi:hypothetical protein